MTTLHDIPHPLRGLQTPFSIGRPVLGRVGAGLAAGRWPTPTPDSHNCSRQLASLAIKVIKEATRLAHS
jgi:hypothetical protein